MLILYITNDHRWDGTVLLNDGDFHIQQYGTVQTI